jgi:hypothetical protein
MTYRRLDVSRARSKVMLGRGGRRMSLRDYGRALLAALMIVIGLLLFTIAFANVIGPPN